MDVDFLVGVFLHLFVVVCCPTGVPWDTAPYTATLFNRLSVQCYTTEYNFVNSR